MLSAFDQGVVATYQGILGYDDAIIDEIVEVLSSGSTTLEQSPPSAVPNVSFGGSPAAAQLGTHTNLARQVVAQSIREIAVGLESMRGGVAEFRRGTTAVDESAEVDSVSIRRDIDLGVSCVGPNDFATPNVCVPTDSSGND